jgi:hypothetical protein
MRESRRWLLVARGYSHPARRNKIIKPEEARTPLLEIQSMIHLMTDWAINARVCVGFSFCAVAVNVFI